MQEVLQYAPAARASWGRVDALRRGIGGGRWELLQQSCVQPTLLPLLPLDNLSTPNQDQPSIASNAPLHKMLHEGLKVTSTSCLHCTERLQPLKKPPPAPNRSRGWVLI